MYFYEVVDRNIHIMLQSGKMLPYKYHKLYKQIVQGFVKVSSLDKT